MEYEASSDTSSTMRIVHIHESLVWSLPACNPLHDPIILCNKKVLFNRLHLPAADLDFLACPHSRCARLHSRRNVHHPLSPIEVELIVPQDTHLPFSCSSERIVIDDSPHQDDQLSEY